MIIALISDMHGNFPALKAILKDANRAKVKHIWCLGDLVGYIPFPNECIDLIQKDVSECVVGNYDRKVIRFKQKRKEWKTSKKPAKFDAFEWNHQHLNSQNRQYLRSLPEKIYLKRGKFKILLTHASPESIDEPVYPETSRERLVELGKIADADIIVMGHTHRFMNRKVGHQWFINPGSVGMPVQKDLRASYALLDISQDKINVTERKIPYDISQAIEGLEKVNLSGTLQKMIRLEYGFDLENDFKAPTLTPQYILKAIRRLAGECHYEKQHSEHVTLLALNLFDELQPLLKLTNEDRFLLNCAALLHDIGWIEGQKGHHKTAMKIILASQTLPFPNDQRRMVALIARYHRKALPKDSHPLFSQLSEKDKQKIRILGGILRIADGLDRTHTCVVKSIKCDLGGKDILVQYKASGSSTFEKEAAYKKSDLLIQALDKNIQFLAF
jgi:putative phosphoesterase